MVVALAKTLFTALVCFGARCTQGALYGKTTQNASHGMNTHHGAFLAKPNQNHKDDKHLFWLNLEKHYRRQKLQDVKYFVRSNLGKHLKALTLSKQGKSKKTKIYRPNNRTAELTANQDKPFYKRMMALSNSLGLVGNATYGLAFHLGRHTKESCGFKWEEGCRLAVACYNTFEEGGCCQQWDGQMDLTGACEPCSEALGYCDDCYEDSQCGNQEESHHHHHDLKDIFNMIDADGSGACNRNELKQFAVMHGLPHDDRDLDKFMAEADKDSNGLIDFEEFKMHAHGEHKEQKEELRKYFNMADADKSGAIDRDEMREFIRSMHGEKEGHSAPGPEPAPAPEFAPGPEPAPAPEFAPAPGPEDLAEVVDYIMKKGDNDGDGLIDFEEFVELAESEHEEHEEHEIHEHEIKQFFDAIDSDGSGALDRGEIQRFAATHFGEKLDKKELDEIMKKVDTDGNGQINFEEFKREHEEEQKRTAHEEHGEWAEEVYHEDMHDEWEDVPPAHVGEWEEYDELEEKGMDPSAVSNPCGEKWDYGCSDAWECYQDVKEHGCCDAGNVPPKFFLENECAACAGAKGICDDCFPESPCGGPPPDPPAPPMTYWTIIGNRRWAKHSSGEKHPECAADSSTTSQQSNKYGDKLGVVCCDENGVGSRPGCKSAYTWEAAVNHCQETGLGLCTRSQIEKGAGRGTGCGFDAYLVWTSTPCKPAKGGDDCLIADPKWHCMGSQCIPAEDYDLYTAEGGAWCLTADHELCQKADKNWCGGECHCPGNCPHACGRCPAGPAPERKVFMLSAHSSVTPALHSLQEPSGHMPVLPVASSSASRDVSIDSGTSLKLKSFKSESESTTNYGDHACACVGIDNVEGKRMVRLDETTTAAYPADLGASCQAWDDARSFLGCMSGQHPGKGKGWCAQKWCYVDPCKCDISTLPKTSAYLPGATYQGKPIYYSYATCGGKDEFTVNRKEACVNQMSKGECDQFPKCGWHEGRCMGKELMGMCQKRLHGFTWGRSNCRCIGVANLLGDLVVNVGGKRKGKFPRKVTKYPADVGATCQAWDNSRHPDCKNEVKSMRPDWCEQKWCYVDPCTCDLPIPAKTSRYIPGALYQGIPIYYSYHTCGGEDTWTAKHHKTACVHQKSEKDCDKLSKCAWTANNKCVGKELAGMCPGMAVEEEKKPKSSAYARIVSFVLLLIVTHL